MPLEHQWSNDEPFECLWCPAKKNDTPSGAICYGRPRAPSRPHPPSVVDPRAGNVDFTDRIRELQRAREEARNRQEQPASWANLGGVPAAPRCACPACAPQRWVYSGT